MQNAEVSPAPNGRVYFFILTSDFFILTFAF
jgi:hypothetical protein